MAAMFGWFREASVLGFALEIARAARGPAAKVSGNTLMATCATEVGVGRAPDLSHAAGADWRGDFVGAEPRADSQRHGEPHGLYEERCGVEASPD